MPNIWEAIYGFVSFREPIKVPMTRRSMSSSMTSRRHTHDVTIFKVAAFSNYDPDQLYLRGPVRNRTTLFFFKISSFGLELWEKKHLA